MLGFLISILHLVYAAFVLKNAKKIKAYINSNYEKTLTDALEGGRGGIVSIQLKFWAFLMLAYAPIAALVFPVWCYLALTN